MGAPSRRHDYGHLNGRPNVDLKYCTSSVSEHINVHARTYKHTHKTETDRKRVTQRHTKAGSWGERGKPLTQQLLSNKSTSAMLSGSKTMLTLKPKVQSLWLHSHTFVASLQSVFPTPT